LTTLLLSNNYVAKHQSLKLLGEILLDRANFNVMTRYIAQEGNLKMMMNETGARTSSSRLSTFLKWDSMVLSTIYYADYLFLRKVFVANPKNHLRLERY
jgi:hypothetical protein